MFLGVCEMWSSGCRGGEVDAWRMLSSYKGEAALLLPVWPQLNWKIAFENPNSVSNRKKIAVSKCTFKIHRYIHKTSMPYCLEINSEYHMLEDPIRDCISDSLISLNYSARTDTVIMFRRYSMHPNTFFFIIKHYLECFRKKVCK